MVKGGGSRENIKIWEGGWRNFPFRSTSALRILNGIALRLKPRHHATQIPNSLKPRHHATQGCISLKPCHHVTQGSMEMKVYVGKVKKGFLKLCKIPLWHGVKVENTIRFDSPWDGRF